MPVFVMLTTLTDEGMKTLKHKPERIKEVDREVRNSEAVLKIYKFF
jgi:GYD domain.